MTESVGSPVRPGSDSIRVGTDLVSVAEVAGSIDRFGDRYLGRVYTADELADCAGPTGHSAERRAARVAAKEAVLKALRPAGAVDPRDIEVRLGPDGSPGIAFGGRLAHSEAALGVVDSSISLTHDGGFASAVCIFVTSPYHDAAAIQESDPHV